MHGMEKKYTNFGCLGFSLVELMVSLVIGLLILAGAVQLVVISKRNFDKSQELSEYSANVYILTEMVVKDFRKGNAFFSAGEPVDEEDGKVDVIEIGYFSPGVRTDSCPSGELMTNKRLAFYDDELRVEVACDGESLEPYDGDPRGDLLLSGLVPGSGYFVRPSDYDHAWEIGMQLESEGRDKYYIITAAVRSEIVVDYDY